MSQYAAKIKRGKAEHGDKFCADALAKQFIPYYENGVRIKVQFSDGRIESGTVAATTGWIPCFLLKHRKTNLGSSTVLGDKDKIIAVQIKGKYRPII